MTKFSFLTVTMIAIHFLSACTNITQKTTGLTNALVTPGVSNSTTFTHTLKNFSYDAVTAPVGGANQLSLKLTTDTSKIGYQALTGFCGLAATNPCVCELVWTQINTAGGTAFNYDRTKRVPVTEVQSGLVKCLLSQDTWNEIPDATVISFKIVPILTNITGLNTSVLHWKKGTSLSSTGDFLDDTLTPFRNIHRYTCFSKNATSRAHEVLNQYSNATNAAGTSVPVILGSRYCTGTATAPSLCPPPRSGFTAQSYYRNFYIRSDKLGEINSTNDTYDCPKVLESIKYSAGQSIPASESDKYWPLDTTFSLATSRTSEWSIGVPAATHLFKANDSNSVQNLCADEANANQRLVDGKTVIKCLGYAKKPNVNGTCGTIQDSNGRQRPLTRLRRYRVVYPPMFDSNGKVLTGNPFADEVYVADRLVVDSLGNSTGSMIYGPKPCNYSWFDHEGVTTRDGNVNFFSGLTGDAALKYATPTYMATSNYQYIETRNGVPGTHRWSVDPDGLVLPNIDLSGSVTNAQNYPSCSATIPWIDWKNGIPVSLRLITTHASRADKISLGGRDIYLKEIHSQTVDPWTPNYLEDLSFSACVPLPTEFVEPPLQIYKMDNNTMGWCAKVYPTQNPYWYDLNKLRKPQNPTISVTANLAPLAGYGNPVTRAPVKIYSSHDLVTNDALDADLLNAGCTGTLGDKVCALTGFVADANCTNYLTRVNKTCDRTVIFDPNQQYLGFPLLAQDSDINKMLKDDLAHDRNFSCQYSVNADSSKIGTKTPSSGCCGIVGSLPHKLLRNLTNGNGAHLEPYQDPSSANDARFCGWPVD